MEELCGRIHYDENIIIILVENFNYSSRTSLLSTSSSSPSSTITSIMRTRNFLEQTNCPFEYFNGSNVQMINAEMEIQINRFINYRLLFIIDMIPKIFTDQFQFNDLFLSLDKIFPKCTNCFPFIILFQQSIDELSRLMDKNFIQQLNRKFRSTLVSIMGHNHFRVIHIRPILDGCLQYQDQTFKPTTIDDFNRMQKPYTKCNLNQTMLTMVVNNV